jgi:cytidine deaminase
MLSRFPVSVFVVVEALPASRYNVSAVWVQQQGTVYTGNK